MKSIKKSNLFASFIVMLFFFSTFFTPWHLSAQEKWRYNEEFPKYTEHLASNYGIAFNPISNFKNLDEFFLFLEYKNQRGPRGRVGNMYGPAFLSDKKDCMIMFGAIPNWYDDYRRDKITSEIRSALGLYFGPKSPLNKDSVEIRFNDYVTIVTGKKATEMFNADSIFVYDLPNTNHLCFLDESIEKMRKEKLPYCTKVVVYKNDGATMEIKLFFTEKGEKRKNYYIEQLSKTIWYDDKFIEDRQRKRNRK